MKKIARLRKEARDAATFRGHVLPRKWWYSNEGLQQQSLTCLRCGKSVYINMKPAPNEIDIGGEAVAIHCDLARVEIYKRTIKELTKDIKDIGSKTYLATAISSHLRKLHPDLSFEVANDLVNNFFLREAERSL